MALDHETVVEMLLSTDSKYRQLGDYVRDVIATKHGPKTERFEGQLLLFPTEAESLDTSPSPDAAPATASDLDVKSEAKSKSSKPKRAGHGRKPMPEGLPRVPVIAGAPSAANLPCSCCGRNRVAVRQVFQNSRYQIIPAVFYIEELYSVIYGCLECGDTAPERKVTVPEPVENGIAAPALLAQIAVSKGVDHLPFNRQSAIYSRSGVELNRSTLADLYAHVARILAPLYAYMHLMLLQSKVICTDDTPVKTRDRSKSRKIKTGRTWIYMGDKDYPVNLFDFTEGRGRDGPLTFLKGFTGFLQGDCFSGNLAVCAAIGTVLVACLAHARRYFIKAMHRTANRRTSDDAPGGGRSAARYLSHVAAETVCMRPAKKLVCESALLLPEQLE